jgi:hypothetical protein
MSSELIVSGYARMWPRQVFGKFPPAKGAAGRRKKMMAKSLEFLQGPGVYVLYRDDMPYYIGQAGKLRHRLWGHALNAESRYFHFWNFFSAFAVANPKHRDELEGVLIAAMPTANSAKPKLQRERMPPEVRELLLRQINLSRAASPTASALEDLKKQIAKLR